MGKFTAIQTYSRFLSLWNENKISRNSLTFILETGQLYTHGIFLNSVAYGAEANGAIDITIAGTSKSLSLSSHTHSNYLEKNKNIDIGTYKIVSGDKDLLYYNAGNTYLGNSTSPVYLVGTEGKIVKGSTAYTLLDTENFSILSQTANGIILSNSALFKYGSKTFSIDYIKRYNSTSNFDSLNSVTSAGTTTVNGKKYGFMTFYEEGASSPSWSLIRIDVADKKLEFRTSSNPTTWISPTNISIPTNTATVAGIVSAPGENNSGKVWKTNASGTPAWRDEVSNTWRNIRINDEDTDSLTTGTDTGALYIKEGSGIKVTWKENKIVIRNNSLNIWKPANTLLEGYIPKLTTDGGTISTQASEYVLTYVSSNTGTVTPVWKLLPAKAFENTWNANAVGVAGYVAAPTKAANANMTWQTDAEGVPAWRASNNHSHSYLPLSGGKMTGPLTWSGNTAIPERSTVDFIVCIDAFADGGTTKWASLATLKTSLGLGSNAYTSTAYLPLAGGTMNSGAQIIVGSIANSSGNNGGIQLRERGYATTSLDGTVYTDGPGITFHWGGRWMHLLNMHSNALYWDNTKISLDGHKHAYTDLTGSGTTANQAIVSTGTANGWTLKALGSRAFDSTDYLPLAGGTMVGTISAVNESYGGGGFHNGYANIILRGNTTTGTSGIVFSSSKGNTSINRPSDCAFIQYHPYGVSAATAVGTNPTINTSGEAGRFVIGIHNDTGDLLWLQTSAVNDLKHVVGANVYTIYDSGNLPAYPTKSSWNYDDRYVSSLTINGNLLRWVKNGSNNDITIPYAINADTVDGYHEDSFFRYRGNIATSYVDLTTYSSGATNYQNPSNGIYMVPRSGYSGGFIAFTGDGSTSGLDIYFEYSKGSVFKFRRRIDSNRLSGDWETFITSSNIGTQSVNYATSAGNSDTVDNQHFKWSNDSNSPTYLWAANSSGTAFLCARGSMSVNYANYAGYATRLDGGAIASWGTLTSGNGFSGIAADDWGDKGAFCWAGKNGQMYMQVDGWFYLNEGQYRVLDTSDIGSSVASQSSLTNYLPLSGGNMTGNIVATGGSNRLVFRHLDGQNCASNYDLFLQYYNSTENGRSTRVYFGGDSYYIDKDYYNGSCNYANSAGNADTVDSLHAFDFVRAYVTTNNNIDSDWGQSFKTFDPIPSGNPPAQNPNISTINIGDNFVRRKQLAFLYNVDDIYYRRRTDGGWNGWKKIAFTSDIPTVNNASLTLQTAGTTQTTFYANDSTNRTFNVTCAGIGAYTKNEVDNTFVNVSGDVMTGALTIKGVADTGQYSQGGFNKAYANIILQGDNTYGVSGIVFKSMKGNDTNINTPSDVAFILYHPMGVTAAAYNTTPTEASSGELGRLVIGIGNDTGSSVGEELWLQTAGANDLKHYVVNTAYTILDSGNFNTWAAATSHTHAWSDITSGKPFEHHTYSNGSYSWGWNPLGLTNISHIYGWSYINSSFSSDIGVFLWFTSAGPESSSYNCVNLSMDGNMQCLGKMYANLGFVKGDSSDSYVLLGGGGHAPLTNLQVSGTATSVTSLNVGLTFIYATLTESATLGLSAAMSVGQVLTVLAFNNGSTSITLTVPSAWKSLDGYGINIGALKFGEISILCYANGSYMVSSKVQ